MFYQLQNKHVSYLMRRIKTEDTDKELFQVKLHSPHYSVASRQNRELHQQNNFRLPKKWNLYLEEMKKKGLEDIL